MQMVHSIENDVCRIKLSGEIDHHEIASVRESIDALIADNKIRELQIDLEGISFMDSSGLGLVLGRYRKMSDKGGKTVILNAGRTVEKILKMASVDKLIEMKGSESDEK